MAEPPSVRQPADIDDDAAWVRLMDDMQTLLHLRAGETITQDQIDSLMRLDEHWREDGERVADAYHRGYTDALRKEGGQRLVDATERADAAQTELVVHKALRKFDEQRGFRRGAQVCREVMARFAEQDGAFITAGSIRLNWHPDWGDDPGPPQADGALEAPRTDASQVPGIIDK